MSDTKRSHQGKPKKEITLASLRGKRLLTLAETAVVLGVKVWRAAELARQDALPKVKLGKRSVKIDARRLEEFIDAGGLRVIGPSVPVEKRSGLARRPRVTSPAVTAGTVDAQV
jgi:hypothetical protein